MTKELEINKEVENSVIPHIVNEYSKLKKILVVPTPNQVTSFTDLKVNPIQEKAISNLDPNQRVVVYEGAAECHKNLLEVLKNNGVELVYSKVVPIKEGHTPLFTRDAGVIIEDIFIPSSMRFPYRQVEVQGALDHINPKNIFVTELDYKIEGGDVMFLEKDFLLIGTGPRTNSRGIELLQSIFPAKRFESFETKFHIDTTMGILGNKHLLMLPDLVPSEVLGLLIEKGYSFVEAEPSEYDTGCTNVIAINDRKVIAPAENKVTNQRIRESGVEVIEVELKNILSLGGGPHCLTLPLVREQ